MTTQERKALLRRHHAVFVRAMDFDHYSDTRYAPDAQKMLLHAANEYRRYRSKLAIKYGWEAIDHFEKRMRDPLTYSI